MPYESKVYNQDMKTALMAFEKEEFGLANIYSNRIMANAFLFGDSTFALPAFFVKDVIESVIPLKQSRSSAPLATAKETGLSFIRTLITKTKDGSFSNIGIWSDFFNFNEQIRGILQTQQERNSYTSENPKFSHEAYLFLVNYLDSHQNLLTNPNNRLLAGILNEMNRLYKCHGVFLSDAMTYSLIFQLARNEDYVRFDTTPENFSDRIHDEISSQISSLVSTVRKLEDTPTTSEKVDTLLLSLIAKWREYFLIYTDIRVPRPIPTAEVSLPEDVKKKLTEAIAKSLEEEVKK